MPEWRRIVGVPMDPAERLTSLRAVTSLSVAVPRRWIPILSVDADDSSTVELRRNDVDHHPIIDFVNKNLWGEIFTHLLMERKEGSGA